MKKQTYVTLSVLTISLAIFSCKKEDKKDETTSQNVPPTVSITFPITGNGYAIEGSDTTLTLTANASDTDGNITKVEFYVDGTKVGEDVTYPYSYDHLFPVNENHQYQVKAIAKDDDGAFTESNIAWTAITNI